MCHYGDGGGFSPKVKVNRNTEIVIRSFLLSGVGEFERKNAITFYQGKLQHKNHLSIFSPAHTHLQSASKLAVRAILGVRQQFLGLMMMIAFITIKKWCIPLIEGLCARILYFRFEIIGGFAFTSFAFLFKRRENGRNVTSFRAWPLWPATWVGYELGGSAPH